MKENIKKSKENDVWEFLSRYKFGSLSIERKFVHSGSYICTIREIEICGSFVKIKEEADTIYDCVKNCVTSIHELELKLKTIQNNKNKE